MSGYGEHSSVEYPEEEGTHICRHCGARVPDDEEGARMALPTLRTDECLQATLLAQAQAAGLLCAEARPLDILPLDVGEVYTMLLGLVNKAGCTLQIATHADYTHVEISDNVSIKIHEGHDGAEWHLWVLLAAAVRLHVWMTANTPVL